MVRPRTWRTLDLFAGCGGLTEGLAQASGTNGERFECLAAVDNWAAACNTFAANHRAPAICSAVDEVTVRSVLDRIGKVDVVVGGPPCQGFSTSGKRALDDPRNSLVRAFLHAIKLAEPTAFLMENVSGFTTFQDGQLLRDTVDVSVDLGFKVHAGIVLASLFGVPQRRRRFILVGIRAGEFVFPGESTPATGNLWGERSSVIDVDQTPEMERGAWTFDDAVSDLPPLRAGEQATEYLGPPQNSYQEYAREGAGEVLREHCASAHSSRMVRMMGYIPCGKSAFDCDVRELMPPDLRPTTGFPNSYARIRGDQPAPTITRNFTTPSSANCIHPRSDRALSLREGARCQSFRDRYIFLGTHGDKRLMIGNAVPPLLAKVLGERLLEALSPLNTSAGVGGRTRLDSR